MKKVLLFLGFVPFILFPLNADPGSCLMYHAKFYLQNGEIFNGSFEAYSSNNAAYSQLDLNGENEYCSDEGLLEVLKILQQKALSEDWSFAGAKKKSDIGKIPVFKNFYAIQPLGLNDKVDIGLQTYAFVSHDDIIFLDVDSIAKIVFWEADYSPWGWESAELVVGSQGMIDTVITEKYWNTIFAEHTSIKMDSIVFPPYYGLEGFVLINYNPRNNVAELKRLAQLKLKALNETKFWLDAKKKEGLPWNGRLTKDQEKHYQFKWEKQLQNAQTWFWKRNILLIKVWGYC